MAIDTEKKTLRVELTINGRKVSGEPGQTILDVVRAGQLDDIPTLCHDPRLEPYGSCFLCVVEVKGSPRLLPSCVTRIRDGMEVTTRSDRIVTARKTALELLLSDHYADCVCPGQRACPAGVDIQGYLSLSALGYHKEALDLIRERNPLPVVCGRVCVRKCEVACLRNQVDEPVGINFIKRYVAENHDTPPLKPADIPDSGRSVAVVGGGPGGLSCANYLALRGHRVTIFESLPKLGGMLRYGIPEYRLPREQLDHEIQGILDLGIRVETGKALGRDFTLESLRGAAGFDAVFVALGAPLGKKMGLENEDSIVGVSSALDFLRDCELEGKPELKGKVVVVGGGNSAIDAARTALRCGAEEVTIVYRRTRAEMPAHHEEVDAAEAEGANMELLAAPLDLIAENGRLRALRCQRMELGEPDASGRRRPVPIPGAVIDIDCSYIFAAIGQDTDLTALEGDSEDARPAANRWATLEANAATMESSVKGVFTGGDVVLGPSTVIDAIAHGRRAALAIDQYLTCGEAVGPEPDFKSRRDFFGEIPGETFDNVEHEPRCRMPEREAAERVRDFREVETGLDEAHTKHEAVRCMECGCKSVFHCDLKRYAGEYGVDIARLSGEVRRHKVDRSHPLISLDPNKCILCGRCIRTCSEIVGLGILGFVGRGFDTTVRPALGKSMAESDCIACGACVESCPTGALEARFQYSRQGPWKTTRVPSVCTFCSVGCRLDLNVAADGLLWATAPNTLADGRGELCRKGRFGTGLVQGPDRLKRPLVKKNGKLEETGWDEALQAAAAALGKGVETGGPESVAILAAPRMTIEESHLVARIAASLGTGQVGSYGRARRGGPRHDLDAILGRTASTCAMEDLAGADLILIAGADPGATHPVLGMAVRRALRAGAEMIAVNSGPIDLLRPEDLWLDARRGTAGILYGTMMERVLGRPGTGDGIPGADALRESIASLTPERAAEFSGVEAAKIQSAADRIVRARKVIAVYDLDETLERSSDDLKALAQLLALTGHLGSPGEGLLLLHSDCNSVGARLAGIDRALDPHRARTALVLFENPLADYRAHRELAGIESFVVMDHFMTETARAADVVLPAATLAESEGTVVSFDGRIGTLERASSPAGGLANVDILARLAAALGTPDLPADPEELRRALAAGLGLDAAELERARGRGAAWPAEAVSIRSLEPIRIDSTASTANIFPYATLDAVLEKKLAEME
ncbi:MAG: molybdopterin-dependent oxidoreductase [Acidobacteria bacterium]|nr:molybdopterin-dependent oxidoreductase [Acidobacteriota bacterium]